MNRELEPLDPTRGGILGDEVFERIGQAIVEGHFEPGVRLRDIDLAEQLGISRTPVREALQRLERIGLVEVAVGRYTRVTNPDEKLRNDTADFTVYFIGNAIRVALARADDHEVRRLIDITDRLIGVASRRDAPALLDSVIEFLDAVTAATENRFFIGVAAEAQPAIRRNLTGWEPFARDPDGPEAGNLALRDAIATRDVDTAEAIIRSFRGLL
ncbi:GntR family transcriptional regulator [Microbacterium sp.]|uniref:GntR family transcriptional regulator n=1 Tax=Microbacterium sp. TaxID=51671 RepID=UPI003A8AA035